MCQISSGCELNALLRERQRIRAEAMAARITKAWGVVLVAGFCEPIRRTQRPRPISMTTHRMDAPEMTQAHQAAFDKGIGELKFNSGTSRAVSLGTKSTMTSPSSAGLSVTDSLLDIAMRSFCPTN